MVAKKSTPIELRSAIAELNQKIRALESEQSALKSELSRLRRRRQSWEVYERTVEVSDAYLKITETITKLYAKLSALIDRLRAEEAKQKVSLPPKPEVKKASQKKVSDRKQRDKAAQKKREIEAQRQREAEAAAEIQRKRRATVERKKREAEAEVQRQREAEATAEAKRKRDLSNAKRKATLAKKKVEADFAKSTEQRLNDIVKERPLTPVEPVKGEHLEPLYTRLPPVEQIDWKKVFTNVEDHFIDVWGIGKRLRSKTRNTNEKLIAGLKSPALLDLLNAQVEINNINKQLGRLPRLVRHMFADDHEANIARSYTGVELLYPEGLKPFAWIFVPNPDAKYEARIVRTKRPDGTIDDILEIEQPVSKIREAFIPFTPMQLLDPVRVAEEVSFRFPDAMAAFIRAGAFGLVRGTGEIGFSGGDPADLVDSLSAAIMKLQNRYSPGGDMGDKCDPDDPKSRHWKNWMSGVVVFRAKDEKDFLGYISRYNAIMADRKEKRREAAKKSRKKK
jgi:hypothetical protein